VKEKRVIAAEGSAEERIEQWANGTVDLPFLCYFTLEWMEDAN
jgi:hypothetical protein